MLTESLGRDVDSISLETELFRTARELGLEPKVVREYYWDEVSGKPYYKEIELRGRLSHIMRLFVFYKNPPTTDSVSYVYKGPAPALSERKAREYLDALHVNLARRN